MLVDHQPLRLLMYVIAASLIAMLIATGFTSAARKSNDAADVNEDLTPIDVSILRIDQPEFYRVDKGDVLCIFVEGILGQLDETEVMYPPSSKSDFPPSIGEPITIQGDGTIKLPKVDAIQVRGCSVLEVEKLVKSAYLDGANPVLKKQERILVTR